MIEYIADEYLKYYDEFFPNPKIAPKLDEFKEGYDLNAGITPHEGGGAILWLIISFISAVCFFAGYLARVYGL